MTPLVRKRMLTALNSIGISLIVVSDLEGELGLFSPRGQIKVTTPGTNLS